MLRHIALILSLVVVASCSRTPTLTSCRLVGTWQLEHKLSANLEEEIRASGKDPAVVLEQAKAVLEAKGIRMRESFLGDGKWVASSETRELSPSGSSTWELLEDRGDRVSIRLAVYKPGSTGWERSFVFETPNLIREVGGDFDGERYARVAPDK